MTFEIKNSLTQAMKSAMKAKQKDRLGVIRALLAAVKQKEVDERIDVDDELLLAILDKQLKQRKESAKIYHDADRSELAEKEEFEISVIQDFLPQALNEEEITAIIDAAISSTGASSMKDMGKVMAQVKPQVQGKADMGAISKIIKSQLA